MRPPNEIAITEANLRDRLTDLLQEMTSSNSLNDVGPIYFNVCYFYRLLGICALLMNADVTKFQDCLFKSARAKLHFLSLSGSERTAGPITLCTSKNFPFYDALAIADFKTADELAFLSPKNHFEGVEHEDDFLHQHFLHLYVTSGMGRARNDLEDILGRYEEVISGKESCRFGLCASLISNDSDRFNLEINQLVMQRHEKFQELSRMTSFNPDILKTEKYIFIEGIALVQLAEARGLRVHKEYRFIPSIARKLRKTPFPAHDSWKEIDLL